jgi:hypothetical protein
MLPLDMFYCAFHQKRVHISEGCDCPWWFLELPDLFNDSPNPDGTSRSISFLEAP